MSSEVISTFTTLDTEGDEVSMPLTTKPFRPVTVTTPPLSDAPVRSSSQSSLPGPNDESLGIPSLKSKDVIRAWNSAAVVGIVSPEASPLSSSIKAIPELSSPDTNPSTPIPNRST